jgi:hypothetical protein
MLVDLNNPAVLLVMIEYPMAFHHHMITVAGRMHEFPFPPSATDQLRVNLLQRFWKLRLQQAVTYSANRFLFAPAIELLGTPIPEMNPAVDAPSNHALVLEIQQRLLGLGLPCRWRALAAAIRKRT